MTIKNAGNSTFALLIVISSTEIGVISSLKSVTSISGISPCPTAVRLVASEGATVAPTEPRDF